MSEKYVYRTHVRSDELLLGRREVRKSPLNCTFEVSLLKPERANSYRQNSSGGVEPARGRVRRYRHGHHRQELGDAAHGRRAGRRRPQPAVARHRQLQLRAAAVEAGDRPAVQVTLGLLVTLHVPGDVNVDT